MVCTLGPSNAIHSRSDSASASNSISTSNINNEQARATQNNANQLHQTQQVSVGANVVAGIPYKPAIMSREQTKKGGQDVHCLTSERRSLCGGDQFRVKCQWSRVEAAEAAALDTKEWRKRALFFCERYHVYTQTYKLLLRGKVEHEPWPLEPVYVDELDLSNIHVYGPAALQPVVRLMATREPDHTAFSPGVGPVNFHMLAPFHPKV
jgi:hypothetical protein